MKRSYRESSGALYAPRRTWKELIRDYGLGIALIALLGLLVMIYSGIFSSHQEHEKIAERISSLTSTTNYPEEEEDDEVKDLNLPIAEGQVMHVLVGGKKPGYAFLLVHGGSRKNQEAAQWTPHLEFFGKRGRYYAVDLLGHGESTPGKDSAMDVSAAGKLKGLEKLVEEQLKDVPLIVIGRSAGAILVLDMLKRYNQNVRGLVLIAPAAPPSSLDLHKAILDIPTLLVWSHADPVSKFDRAEGYKNLFTKAELLDFPKVGGANDPSWVEHMPESIAVTEFQERMVLWLSSLPK